MSDAGVTVLGVEHRWKQPFRWGLLLAFDDDAPWVLPEDIGDNTVRASPSCLAVPVLHSQDVEIPDDWPPDRPLPEAEVHVSVLVDEPAVARDHEWEGTLECPSGELTVGDAENERRVAVPAGRLEVSVARDPVQFAERVTLLVRSAV